MTSRPIPTDLKAAMAMRMRCRRADIGPQMHMTTGKMGAPAGRRGGRGKDSASVAVAHLRCWWPLAAWLPAVALDLPLGGAAVAAGAGGGLVASVETFAWSRRDPPSRPLEILCVGLGRGGRTRTGVGFTRTEIKGLVGWALKLLGLG